MPVHGRLIRGKYHDSVTLMSLSKKLRQLPGVQEAVAVMATEANKATLEASGLFLPELITAKDSDLAIVVRAVDEPGANSALAAAEEFLVELTRKQSETLVQEAYDLEGALRLLPEANLALISVPGRYATETAYEALAKKLHVMIFSDNVPLEAEIELKNYARQHGLLVMGPDCGTAIIDGVPLGFANAVNRGSIGLVGASGTGLQEVMCILSNHKAGISQAIGTGSRDIKKEVGGITFLQGINLLGNDENTEVIVLIAKPPDQEVLEKIDAALCSIEKPVVSVFLGANTQRIAIENVYQASTLEEAAWLALALLHKEDIDAARRRLAERDTVLRQEATSKVAWLKPGQKYIRGLFSGGTFCHEAQTLFSRLGIGFASNVGTDALAHDAGSQSSRTHQLIDYGADEFTIGKPHPMIDFSTRIRAMLTHADDPETAVILFDIVLGYGAHPDPLHEMLPAIAEANRRAEEAERKLIMICSVVGTDQDPQCRRDVVTGLKKAGVSVAQSNAEASKLAAFIASGVVKRS